MPAVRKDTFTDLQWQIVYGSVLGDGSLGKPTKGVNYHLTVAHSRRQVSYLRWKHEQLRPLVGPHNVYRRYDSRHDQTYETWRFASVTLPALTELRREVYEGGSKGIPQSLLDRMDTLALAVWYMDDGGLQGRDGCSPAIATVCFSLEDVGRACDWLNNRWGIASHPTAERRIMLSASSRERFRELIEPHVIPEMQYKLPAPFHARAWTGQRDTGGRFLKKGGDTSDARLGGTNLRD
jgi:hypothetical protein